MKEKIYDAIMGEITMSNIPNIFEEGSKCDLLYDAIYAAKTRLNEAMNAIENPDIELIIDNMFAICREVSYAMFDVVASHKKYVVSEEVTNKTICFNKHS